MYHGIKTLPGGLSGRQKITHQPLAPYFSFVLRKPHLVVFHVSLLHQRRSLLKGFSSQCQGCVFYLKLGLEKTLVLPLSSKGAVSVGWLKQDIISDVKPRLLPSGFCSQPVPLHLVRLLVTLIVSGLGHLFLCHSCCLTSGARCEQLMQCLSELPSPYTPQPGKQLFPEGDRIEHE